MRHTACGLVLVMGVCMAAVVLVAPAVAGPARGGHYFGLVGELAEGPGEGYAEATADLRVSRSGRRIAPATLAFYCAPGEDNRVEVRLSGPAGRGSPVRIGDDGRFGAAGRRGATRYRLVGRFLTRDLGRVTYTVRRSRSGRLVCRASMKLYRNGLPPFSGCRSQRAFTHLWAETGRVFQQYAGAGSFFTHVYACLFESPSKRVDLGQNYDEERLRTFRLSGPYVAFFRSGCAACIWDQQSIEVRDLRNGNLVSRPDVRFFTRLSDLALKANGSIAWTVERIALGPDGLYPIGYPNEPPIVEAREVWALDSQGQRIIDSGPELNPESLELKDSTLTWINDGTTRSATLD